jgi:hypothetical protein
VAFSEQHTPVMIRKWSAATGLILPDNEKNNLLKLWEDEEQYSSFIKFNNWKISANTKRNDPSIQYGQANYFFRMNLPSDRLLHNVGFVSVTGRIHQNFTLGACSVPFIKVRITTREEIPQPPPPLPPVQSSEINKDFIIEGSRKRRKPDSNLKDVSKAQERADPFVVINNFRSDVQFVCANFIVSTTVAVCGMTADRSPILLDSSTKSLAGDEIEDSLSFCSREPRDIEDLFLIDMDPSRRQVEINRNDSILPEVN